MLKGATRIDKRPKYLLNNLSDRDHSRFTADRQPEFLAMFDQLKTLKAAQRELEQREEMRLQAARNQFAQAQALLQEYNRNPDKNTLRQCMLQLTGCVSMMRSYPEPYLWLAYIYLVLGLPQLSLKYLRVAQHLGCQDPLLAKIQAALQNGFQAPRVKRAGAATHSQTPPQGLAETDFDALYEEVLGVIQTEMRAAMDIPLPLGPTADPGILTPLYRAGNRLSESISLIQGQLDLLDQEMECSELFRKLRGLESRQRMLAQLLEASEQCQALLQTMQGLSQRVSEALLQPSEVALERFLDQCDSIADQLDAFSAQGWAITELEVVYQNLIDQITLLQEQLDS